MPARRAPENIGKKLAAELDYLERNADLFRAVLDV
jgi:hypothetical protein